MSQGQILQYISDGLSLITIGICLIMKIPQIKKIIDSESAVGMSITGLLLELISYSIVMCYNIINGYSLLTYLEYPIILVQQYILIYLVLKYLNLLNVKTLLAVLVNFLIWIGFLTQVLPMTILTVLLPICTPGSASSKIMQLIAIVKAKNAESVSLTTWFLSVFTTSTRIFTIWMDSADVMLITNVTISTCLSLSIVFAALYYKKDYKKVK